jgi:hypothetical protein
VKDELGVFQLKVGIFQGGRRLGLQRGLEPPSSWCLENIGSCSFLQVGACKLGGWSLLPVGAGEYREL